MVKTKLALLAAAAFAVALGTTPGFAQGAATPDPMMTMKVDPAKPFGDVNVTPAAGKNARDIVTWVKTLPAAQQTDLNNRCEYINVHEGEFKVDDLTLCQQWQFGRSPDSATDEKPLVP
jgi:hypothetical protein